MLMKPAVFAATKVVDPSSGVLLDHSNRISRLCLHAESADFRTRSVPMSWQHLYRDSTNAKHLDQVGLKSQICEAMSRSTRM